MKLICSRRTCAEVKRMLQEAQRTSGNASSLTVEVHYYHHTNRPNKAGLNRTHIYSSELHSESLPKNRRVLPVRDRPSYIGAFTELSGETGGQRLDKTAS
jgi:hypothetical protein